MSNSAIERGIAPEVKSNIPLLKRAARWASPAVAVSTLLASACAPQPQVEPTATAAPGVGNPPGIATFTADSPYAYLNPRIDQLNNNPDSVSQADKNAITDAVKAANEPAAATATAEAAKPALESKAESCTILPADYTATLRPNYIEYKNGEKKLTGVVGHVPKNVPVFALQGGLISKLKLSDTRTQASIVNPDDPTMTSQIVSGSLRFSNMNEEPIANMATLGYISEEPEDPNEINFSLTYSKYNPTTGKFSLPTDLVNKACTGVLLREPRIIKVDFLPENAPQTTTHSNTYIGGSS